MKININRKPVSSAWGGGNSFVHAVHEEALRRGHEITIGQADLFIVVDPRLGDQSKGEYSIEQILHNRSKTSKLVYRVNECDQRKGLSEQIDPLVRKASSEADLVIFISDWLRRYHMEGAGSNFRPRLTSKGKVEVIHNGHLSHFKSGKKRDDEICHIVTHHWSDNSLKGADVYQAIAKWAKDRNDFDFTYIGRASYDMPGATIIPPLHGKELGDLLGTFDCYVSGSRFDPGPNHVAEALGCNLPTWVHKDGGGGVEMVGTDHSFSSIEELIEILESGKWKTPNQMTSLPWEQTIQTYFELIESLM